MERVYQQAKIALDNVVVATDDERILDAVKAFGGDVVMTSKYHKSGTDRVMEAYRNLISDADVVINVQGDEPFIDPGQITALMRCFEDERTQIATLVRPFDSNSDMDVIANPNTPKVVRDNEDYALYFSRSVIPFLRNYPFEDWNKHHQYYAHVGIYAYRAAVLDEITRLPQSPLETAESLEQLRWLQAGYRIKTAVTNISTIGIDTPEDLHRAENYLKKINND